MLGSIINRAQNFAEMHPHDGSRPVPLIRMSMGQPHVVRGPRPGAPTAGHQNRQVGHIILTSVTNILVSRYSDFCSSMFPLSVNDDTIYRLLNRENVMYTTNNTSFDTIH